MFTECPECETTFRLSAEDLRRAHGKVRCGECHTVFNALESLAEEPENSTPETTRTTPDYQPAWLINSADNPPGDLEPDLETYENTAYLPDGDVEFEYEFDDEDDDESGAILYIDDASRTASNADTMEEAAADAEDERSDDVSFGNPDFGPDLADPELDDALDDDLDDRVPDFDETIWERIPGVAAAATPEPPATAEPEDLNDSAEPIDPSPEVESAGGDRGRVWERPRAPAAAPQPEAAAVPSAPAVDGLAATSTDGQDDALDVWVAEGGSTLPASDPAAEATAAAPDDDLEFDVPAEHWNQFFEPAPQGPQPIIWEPPALEEPAVASTATTDAAAIPSWHDDGAAPGAAAPRRAGWLQFTGGLLLLMFFAAQLLHYNRDALAAHPQYGEWVRMAYSALDQTLYPEWPLQNNYEIRGSEAVVGESGPDVMDIRAQIAAIGAAATGLPRLRVVLRDRWSNPVAATDFGPTEYAAAADLPVTGLLQPGTVIPARVSIADPGAGVQGFELELCLPRRNTGLECTDQPFK